MSDRGTAAPDDPTAEASARARLIAAGLATFGRHGFDGTSTRAIAERAGVSLGAIPYHFRTKQRLYLAVAEHIAARFLGRLGPTLETVEAVAADPGAAPRARLEALTRLLDAMAGLLLSGEPDEDAGRFILREQMSPTAAFDVLFEGGMGRVHAAVSSLLGGLLGRPPGRTEVRLRASMLMGQVVMFRATRALVLRALGRETYADADRGRIRALVAEHTRLLVEGLRAEGRGP